MHLTSFGECVVRCIGSEARFLWVYMAPTVMQLWQQRSENVHFQSIRGTIEVSCHNNVLVALHIVTMFSMHSPQKQLQQQTKCFVPT